MKHSKTILQSVLLPWILLCLTSCAKTMHEPVTPALAPVAAEQVSEPPQVQATVELPTSDDPASWDRKWAEELARALRQNAQSVGATTPSTAPQMQSPWSGEKARVAVMEFDDKTGSLYQTAATSRGFFTGAPVGRGMKEQLVTALMETGATNAQRKRNGLMSIVLILLLIRVTTSTGGEPP